MANPYKTGKKKIHGPGYVVIARVSALSGSYITQAGISTVKRHTNTYNGTTWSNDASGDSLTVSAVVFDTLQTTDDDARWTADAVGYNFLDTVPASDFADGTTQVQVEYVFAPASGEVFKIGWTIDVTNARHDD